MLASRDINIGPDLRQPHSRERRTGANKSPPLQASRARGSEVPLSMRTGRVPTTRQSAWNATISPGDERIG